MFASGILAMALVSRIKVRKITNIVLLGFVVSVFGPVIDRFIFGRTDVYEFITLSDLSGLGLGLLLQLLIIIFLACFYVYIRTESIKRTIGTGFMLLITMGLMGFIPMYLFDVMWSLSFSKDAIQATAAVILFFLTVIVSLLLVYMTDRKISNALYRGSKPFVIMILIIISLLGVVIAGELTVPSQYIAYEHPGDPIANSMDDVPFALLLVFTVFFACQYLFAFLNSFAPEFGIVFGKYNPLREDVLSRSLYVQFVFFSAIISFGFSVTLGWLPMVLVLVFISSGYLFRTSLVRTKKILASILMGFEATVLLLVGFYTRRHLPAQKTTRLIFFDYYYIKYPVPDTYILSSTILIFGVSVFIIAAVMCSIVYKHKEK
jgi:hypothetical protein